MAFCGSKACKNEINDQEAFDRCYFKDRLFVRVSVQRLKPWGYKGLHAHPTTFDFWAWNPISA